jgi:hypothetical protein
METIYRKGDLGDNISATTAGAFLAIVIGIIFLIVIFRVASPNLPIIAAFTDITGGAIS